VSEWLQRWWLWYDTLLVVVLVVMVVSSAYNALRYLMGDIMDKYEDLMIKNYDNPSYHNATILHPACALLRHTAEWPTTCPVLEQVNKCRSLVVGTVLMTALLPVVASDMTSYGVVVVVVAAAAAAPAA